MKTVLFGIAVILFAILLLLSGIWLPGVGDLMGRDSFAVLAGLAGLVIAGIGTFKKGK